MVSGNTLHMLFTAAMFCTSFTDIVVVTSMSEVLPEAIPKYAHEQIKPARSQKFALHLYNVCTPSPHC